MNQVYELFQEDEILKLRNLEALKEKPYYVDFFNSKILTQLKTTGKNSLLAKACGITKGLRTVVDTTAGLGIDSIMLAKLGFDVVCLERNEMIFKLLADGLARAQMDDRFLKFISGKIQALNMDAINYLKSLDENFRPEVIYLDPMFPDKKSLSKKEMRWLKEIVGEDPDSVELFEVALKVVRNRVVVKRSQQNEKINSLKPAIVFEGNSIRYDVYQVPCSECL